MLGIAGFGATATRSCQGEGFVLVDLCYIKLYKPLKPFVGTTHVVLVPRVAWRWSRRRILLV